MITIVVSCSDQPDSANRSIDDLIRKAHDATAIERNHDVLRREAIADVADAAVNATDIGAAITKASAKVPGDTVPLIAAAVYTAAVNAAAGRGPMLLTLGGRSQLAGSMTPFPRA